MSIFISLGLLVLIAVYICIIVALFTMMWDSLTSAPFVPTYNPEVIEIIQSEIDKQPDLKYFYEPGCGVANISRAIKLKNPELEVWAIETNFWIFCVAWVLNRRLDPKNRINLIRGDFAKLDIKKGEKMFYCYMLPGFMDKMNSLGKFNDSTVITLTFQIKELVPKSEILLKKSNHLQSKVWIYEV